MNKFTSLKSAITASVLVIGLSACADTRRDEVTRTQVRAPAQQGTYSQRSSSSSQRPSSRRAAQATCNSCGVVSGITVLQREGRGSGVGAVLGAVVGGLAGHQVGGGDGQKIATVAGAIGGAFVGNKIEKDRNDQSSYEISVDMENGSERTVTVDNATANGIGIGSSVTVSGNSIALR